MTVGFAGLTESLLAGAFARSAIAKAVLSLEPAGLGVVAEVNAAFCRLSGQEREALVGLPCRLWPLRTDGMRLTAVLDRLARGETVEGPVRLAVTRPDGSAVPVICHLAATGSGYAVAELQISEQRFRAQFAHSAAGQVICDLDGRFVEANPAFADMLGYPVDRILERSYPDLLDPGDLAETRPLLDDLISGHTDHFTHESRLRRADDRWIDVNATVSLVRDHDGRPRHLIGVIIDSTDQRAAERACDQAADELAERNDQLEAANQLKLDIIQKLGFEIRNPLASIRGYAEILDDDWPGLDEAFRSRAVAAVARQSVRLDDIVREVLAMVTPAAR
jgi:PAS domain S-box-containing protein